jgi:hypothetical protein
LEQLDQTFLDTIKQKVAACVEGANNQQMKEIREDLILALKSNLYRENII